MKLRVCKYGEKVLREKATPVAVVDDRLRKLAEDMIETMHESKGVGLAAEQVGHLEKMCVILVNLGEEDFRVCKGDKIAQIVIAPVTQPEIVETDVLDETDRGAGGFGSTGV